MALSTWALPHLSRLLALDDESLKQIIDYSSTLPKEAAAEHLKNLLGDSPQSLEFISTFNSRRETPGKADSDESRRGASATSGATTASEAGRRPRKKKAPLNKLPPPRRPDDYGNTVGGYVKKEEGDYISGRRHEPHLANTLALSDKPDALQLPTVKSPSSSLASSRNPSPKPPPSAAGSLISDLPNLKTSRTSSPAPSKTKISLSGGTSMHGNSSTINDLDSAIRALEIQTNPSLAPSSEKDTAKRRCNCNATRHPLLAAAPNCLNCGKVICVKEGIGPCTFCRRPLLSADDVQGMVGALREERGREKMDANNASHKRADVARIPRPFASSSTPATSDSEREKERDADKTLAAAKVHRDKLLNYQAQNARRTRIIDEAADFETPTAGQSMWSSAQERAMQLKRQQKVLREQEWSARPEWEKRRVVVSVDLVGGKVVRRMADVERVDGGEEEEEEGDEGEIEEKEEEGRGKGSKGTFSWNPLMGGLIRPIWKKSDDGKGKGKDRNGDLAGDNGNEGSGGSERRERKTWRRVQDDNDDNEEWILDGGIYGGRPEEVGERRLGVEEHAQG